MNLERREFFRKVAFGIPGVLLAPSVIFGQQDGKPAPYKQEWIKEFVVAGHRDLARVKTMLADYSNLLNCTWDWGGGDFEMAIGGAGHVGNKEIANYLIAQGARVNIFVLTMLGKTNIVKSVLEEYPDLVFAKGPHGFTLLHHAQQGGPEAEALQEYLLAKGLKETKMKL